MATGGVRIPLSRPEIGEAEIAEVVACLRSGWLTTGPRCERLEREFAARVGARHALAFASCTGALHVALVALGLGPGDEVIVPPLTWPATANMVVACGARPVFADIDPVTWNLSPAAVRAALTPRTRVVIPVHYAGQPADLDGLRAVLRAAGRSDVRILEDAAHAAGAAYRGRPIGACTANGTAAACFSFHPIKNLTTGEGGMLVTDDDRLAEQARLWRFHGVARDAWKAYAGDGPPPATYDVMCPGFKYNLTDIHAAIGIHQLVKLDAMNARRAALAGQYRDWLARTPGCALLGDGNAPVTHAWHLFPIRVPDRGRFVAALASAGIGTGIHFEAVHLTRYYRAAHGGAPGQCPVAEAVGREVVSLPLYPGLADADARHVAEIVREVCDGLAVAR